MITRKTIIEKLKRDLIKDENIYAMWLEGTDAVGEVDQYSDIDICVDFEDSKEEDVISEIERRLEEISEIDYKHVMNHPHPKLRQRIYHLKGTSEYLMIDFCFQLHSRDREESCFIEGSKIEAAKIIFDKDRVISHKKLDLSEYTKWNQERIDDAIYRYTQHSRVIKYVRRGLYLEAYAYYNNYVLNPLIDLIRVRYTPANAEYYLIHMSHHAPKEYVEKMEYFAKINSLEEIEEKTIEAQKWFGELVKALNFKS